ncbi:MAG TPA: SpoIIE family protein phosphatase [Candidatus Blautia intestinigallinarum]|nr:SpoIIE family protein phosphatase [Candidatus Cottocaccamicrobium excrementipullorum]HIV35163.1 SpoIIE family protein phosphatase [Candidatus Blautia intestinigallinarum]
MQEWVIAMLAIIGLFILRDMAKTVLSRRTSKEEELTQLCESHPQKEKAERYAQSFQKLADTFYGMPFRTDYLSAGQVDWVFCQASGKICSKCYQKDFCWGEQKHEMYEGACSLIRAIEDGQEEKVRKSKMEWTRMCARAGLFYEEARQYFQKEKQNLVWNNRMIEGRLAVAQQLDEVSKIMQAMADDLYDIEQAEPELREELQKKLKKKQILIKNVWVMDKVEGRRQVFLNMRARGGQCVSMTEVAQLLSDVYGMPMAPVKDSRCIVNGEYHTVHFIEDVSYEVLYGASKITREQEKVSGDNYSCSLEENGRFVMCLSDGMGSGMDACKESETVVELLEQFLSSGFSQETAAKMVNSALLLRRQDGMFSTVDMCSLDLYTGVCSFLKAGAATTFIKRDHWVEAITSTSLAAGFLQQADFETAARKLYHGDYVIMVTDGVLDALPQEKEEETMKEIIMDVHEEAPREMSRGIMERVLAYSDYKARDDMTVLVAGMWKK